ncbi:fibrillin-1 isoform X3 [Hydra vulgaris]
MVFKNHIDKTFIYLLHIWFISVSGLINDSITDSVNMICPGIYYDSVQNAFHNRILACSFNNHNCNAQSSGFIYSVDTPSKNLPNNSFNPDIGPGYIYGFNASTFRINIYGNLYTNIHNFNVYITMAIYSESRDKSDFGLFDTQQHFSVEIPSSSYNWDTINIIYDLTDSEMNSGFTFDLQTTNTFTRFDDLCIYQICKESYTFNVTSNQCEENTCLVKSCQYYCNLVSGNAICSCPTGYKLNSDNITCMQDLCLFKYCEYQCSMVSGIATCSCPAGYILHSDKISCLQVPTAVTSTSFTIIIPNFPTKSPIVTYYIILVKLSSPFLPTRTSTSYTWTEINNHIDNLYTVGVIDARNSITSFTVGEGSNTNPTLQTGAAYTTFVRGIALDNSTFTSSYSLIVVPGDLTSTKSTTTTEAPTTTAQAPTTTTQAQTTTALAPTTINECGTTCNMPYSKCTKINGSGICSCIEGFQFDSKNNLCIDIDECLTTCRWSNSNCYNTIGSYMCSCNNGFQLDTSKASCVDINECATTCNWKNSNCANKIGSYICSCNTGYQLNSNMTDCIDINECATMCNWDNSNCTNTVGSYYCSCNYGYQFNSRRTSCIDIDECLTTCNWSNSKCKNTNGSYECTCNSGFQFNPNKTSCGDVNECLTTCNWENSNCINTIGSYSCSCEKGFQFNSNKTSCIDINECATTCNWVNSNCTNTIGSYYCSCNYGYRFNGRKTSCIDTDECLTTCNWGNSICTNTIGSYHCSCKSGFQFDASNTSCVDVNECLTACNWNYSNCTNTIGSYSCSCYKGFQLDSNKTSCIDVNECIVDKECSWLYGACNNTYGGFNCYCTGDWLLSDTNKSCIGKPATAVTAQSFQITVGSFLTGLVIRYVEVIIRKQSDFIIPSKSPSQYTSEDIDNHLDGWHRFAKVTVSSNEISSIKLSSKNGNSIAVNSGNSKSAPGRKRRSLDNGFAIEDGELYSTFVIANTENGTLTTPYYPPVITVDPGSLCASISCFKFKNQICSLVNSTSPKCFCQNGFISFDAYSTCEDIDECSSLPNTCGFTNSVCKNIAGGYTCSCQSGFEFSNNSNYCIDINECNLSCKFPNATCTNKYGSYECHCNIAGSFYNSTSDSCQDLDECNMGTNLCDPVLGICHNQNVFATGIPYNCSCPSGWELSKDGSYKCVDTNECLNSCNGVNAFCINTIGSFECYCAAGFLLNSSFQCEAINMCSQINCPSSSNCSMIGLGYFGCTCKPGYSINYMSSCEAINQCQDKTSTCLKSHQVCQNNVSNLGFTCGCRNGYENVGGDCIAIDTSICNHALSINASLCPSNQQCFDLNSSFECRCLPGYMKNGSDECEDINECLNATSCTENAECINFNGGFDCQCKQGYSGKNETNPSAKICYENNVWSSWEQVGHCSELCQTDKKRGKLLFTRLCKMSSPVICQGNTTKEEFCNSDYCDNKIKVLKSVQCESWENMEDSIDLPFKEENQTWIYEIRKWLGYYIFASECKSLRSIDSYMQVKIENLQMEISHLKEIRLSLRKLIDCNTYLQKIDGLRQKYKSVQSRLVTYTTIKTAFKKLQSRMALKQKECMRYSYTFLT